MQRESTKIAEMSELPPGIAPGAPPRPRDSAVVMAARRSGGGEWEVLMGLRSRRSAFFPATWAFPGGALDGGDEPGRPGAFARCAAREFREETGFSILPGRMIPIGTKTTPPFHPIRHRTQFFLAPAPEGVAAPDPPPSPEETEALAFIIARDAIEAWERGEMLFPPPLPPLLRILARKPAARFEDLPPLLALVNEYEERVPRIEFVPGAWMVVVASRTLPPATHTNVWLCGGRRFVIVDPGGAAAADLEQLALVVERRRREGAALESVVLTHHHHDHVDGAAQVAERFGIPIRAHAETAELLARSGFPRPVRGDIGDGDVLDLDGMTLVARWTPGHAPGHLVFAIPERSATLVGDLVSGFSTILVHPDEGDMEAYLASLRRVRAEAPGLLLPAHGPPLTPETLDRVVAHREEREARIFAALSKTPLALGDIARLAYADAPGTPAVLAELQALSHLRRLERAGRVQKAEGSGAAWRLAAEAE